ncbi:MAG TPA: D-glycero-beta-D-manno-heptose-7-phosphate kinase [Alphaproteobacteria bacterium]|nr:D-glycero-beta-D-manno-heptose-7-phosphate kinase [Alphaproteobacteria bacterium]
MHANLIPLVEKLAGHRVLCVGDVMLDRYVYGQVERISPEAPIPVLHTQREAVTLGGAGNVVRNIVALGSVADLIGVVGQDQAGYDLAKQLTELPQVTSYLLTDNGRPTTLKTRFVADGQQLLRADHEIAQALSAEMEQQLLLRVKGALESCAVVILSDYAKGVLTENTLREIIKLAAATNRKVIVDPKGRDFSRYNGAYLLTPNRRELAEASGISIRSVEDAEQAARKLIEAHNLGGVLAKLGGDGVCLVLKGEKAVPFRATAREVFDVSGAGDTVVAAMALALAGKLDPADGAALANVAGAVVVGKIGTAVCSREELARELAHDEARIAEEKITDRAAASEIAERWRKQGFKVGFTNGVFDLLHPGHVSLIRQAKAACDKLVVGLNSDASVKRLKGDSRPVQTEAARAAVLASLADVDQIVIFGEDTPLELIKAVRPSVLVKGADYAKTQVVGGDLVEGWGGRIILANLVDGHSTTATIAKLQTAPAKKTGSTG